jgi:hypothetical protein
MEETFQQFWRTRECDQMIHSAVMWSFEWCTVSFDWKNMRIKWLWTEWGDTVMREMGILDERMIPRSSLPETWHPLLHPSEHSMDRSEKTVNPTSSEILLTIIHMANETIPRSNMSDEDGFAVPPNLFCLGSSHRTMSPPR